VIPGPHRIRAVLFLLAFALGGLALPVAHQLDHLLHRTAEAPVHADAVLETTRSVQLHDCELCEVRLAAATLEAPGDAAVATVPLLSAPAPERILSISPRAFDGRAPPSVLT
jgi:hypothetical protein